MYDIIKDYFGSNFLLVFALIGVVAAPVTALIHVLQYYEKKERLTKKEISLYNLKNHHLFQYFERLKLYDIQTINFNDKTKRYIFIKFVEIKVLAFSHNLEVFLRGSLDKPNNELKREFLNIIYNSIRQYEVNFYNLAQTEEELKILKYIYDSYRQENLSKGNYSIDMINELFNDDNIEDPMIKINYAMYALQIRFTTIIPDISRSMQNLNSQLVGKSIHGYKFK